MSTAPSKAEEIIAVLRSEILRGQYRPGERLPSERDLAARFESNRGAIREAIKKLEQLGIVAVAPGGVRVLPVEEATLEVLGYLLELGEIQKPELISQVLDVLAVMTSLSARSAVVEANDENITDMVQLVDQLVDTIGDKERHAQVWIQFSDKMMSIHRNLVLRLVGNGLRTQFMSSTMNLGFEPVIDLSAVKQQLIRLRDSIKSRDEVNVRDAVIQHFQIIKIGLLESAVAAGADAERSMGNA
ncbi:MAG: FadR family transcriptional regulator [Gammaproteobacteria bacterium]|nr:FadR family transcriptional regulator [Gammaproteobacteria bacterium]MBT3868593.1 FadR family transcriptional regulator [Gammaproteobacteria bacterium]MBT4380351.1 FadR family transcriptional regulator [Gammaproteobacteria bacterium]MBT4617896.1 FadR family transcriptional regulator [Gammaproteobacteria bacterium]MBT5197018.1 FadR family transcriptional regulator [Gammaproteobacteria bacterium]